jgi:hypothetical protein
MHTASLVVWLGKSEKSQERRRPSVRLALGEPACPRRAVRTAMPRPSQDCLLTQDALAIFSAAIDQCDADSDERTRLIIDRLAVELLACIRERTMPIKTASPRLVCSEVRG